MKHGFIKTAAVTPEIRVADCEYNKKNIIDCITAARSKGVRLVVFPELCVTGYTCEDLFNQQTLISSAEQAVCEIAEHTEDIIAVIGAPVACGGVLYNCAVVMYGGEILAVIPKTSIPNYGEFYEKRHFAAAPKEISTAYLCGKEYPFGTKILFSCLENTDFTFAVEICEDLWIPDSPSIDHALAGAVIIANLSCSDETISKHEFRSALVSMQSAKLVCCYIYSDAGDGESTTDMIYSGHNIIAENGNILKESKLFENGMIITETDVQKLNVERRRMGFGKEKNGYKKIIFSMKQCETTLTRSFPQTPFIPSDAADRRSRCELILTMQAAGLKKRIVHSNCKNAVIGISGGLDSCLALLVSVRAMKQLGRPAADITAITMPCFGTTSRTRLNAEKLCSALGVCFKCIDITNSVTCHLKDINHDLNLHNVVYENAQARERMQVLMDTANQLGGIVVGTGDLSELALGWATYNGDHMSMYGVNTSIPKTLVRHIVSYAADIAESSELSEVLRDILDTPVSPELLPAENDEITQETEHIVGPYELHDFFLYHSIRWGAPPDKVLRLAVYAFSGKYTKDVILKWLKNYYSRFFSQQFKRSCLPDGPKVGTLSLSPRGDFRMPSDACAGQWLNILNRL